ncbi:WD40-repeat-containing domain protein [Dipodascopsis tothii]|uniref:WD40-repeat-containing domain protein n=1 Tax=Dipodascopsis tothii TaxID=44089 RepID=UPI0034CF51D0
MNYSTPVKCNGNADWCTPKGRLSQSRLDSTPLSNVPLSQLPARQLFRRTPPSAKPAIHRQVPTPIKVDPATVDWALTGTGPASASPARPSKKQVIRTGVRGDRFIPNRAASAPSISRLETAPAAPSPAADGAAYQADPAALAYQSQVAEACGISLNTRILAFQPPAPQSSKPIDLRSQYNRPLKPVSSQSRRKLPSAPERVLDAPGMRNDYYLNLLDWSVKNTVAVALDESLYMWNPVTAATQCLMSAPEGAYISSVKCAPDGDYVSIGISDGTVQIWNLEKECRVRTMNCHPSRVGVMSWNRNILTTGARDGSIWNNDVRVAQHKVTEFANHTSEVCGLSWRDDGGQLASGGNDNFVNIWDARSTTPKFTKTNHRAAVKALAWCPWQHNLLATGGGANDRNIHFWNTTTGARVNSIDTGSQVSSLNWSHTGKEIVSTHGSANGSPVHNLSLWSYPTLANTGNISGHSSRILGSVLSPDCATLATVAADESLRFWKIFESAGKKLASVAAGAVTSDKISRAMMIR